MASRRSGREQALQALYSIAIGDREPAAAIGEVVGERSNSDHRAFVSDLVLGTIEHTEEADAAIAPVLVGWAVERLPTIDRLVLRMGTFELRHQPLTPRPVIINEAVELAKRFSTEDSGRFVNGVLSAMSKANGHA